MSSVLVTGATIADILKAGHGEIAVTSAAATTPDDTASYKDIAGTFTLSTSPAAHNWDMNTNGQLRYIGTPDRNAIVAISVSMISASNSQIAHFRVAKNGTSLASSGFQRKIGTGADIGQASGNTIVAMSTNDYLTIQVRNESSTATITATNANIAVFDSQD